MTRVVIDLDGDLLADAGEALGSSSQREVIDWALRQALAARERRNDALRRLRAMVADGAIDSEFLSDKRNYRPQPPSRCPELSAQGAGVALPKLGHDRGDRPKIVVDVEHCQVVMHGRSAYEQVDRPGRSVLPALSQSILGGFDPLPRPLWDRDRLAHAVEILDELVSV